MKSLFKLLALLFCVVCFSQPNTDVFLFSLNTAQNNFQLSNYQNISNNEGYDNQPSFFDNDNIFFASTRNGQTDIVIYPISYDTKVFVNFTEGSEYSPLKIPNQNYASAIRLEKDGVQKLYKYNLNNGESEVLIDAVIIGYHVWYNEQLLLSSVLENNGLSLYKNDIKTSENIRLDTNVGRSLHKIPNSNLVSYISKKNEAWEIKSINPSKGNIKTITTTLPNAEDMCWLPNGTILMGHKNKLYALKPNVDKQWREVANLDKYQIKNITRIAVSPDGTKLALVGEGGISEDKNTKSNAEIIVQKQLDAYNNRDIDAFMATYTENVKLYNYPNELRTEGQEAMRKSYEQWFKQTPDLKAEIQKRIVIGNKIIDEEQVTANGQTFNAVAIYEVENGLISKVTFIQ